MTTTPVQQQQSRRVETMKTQLNQASEEYVAAKHAYDDARVAYQVAREKFASVRRLAQKVLSHDDWIKWRVANDSVFYTGVRIKEAIVMALQFHAYDAADRYYADGGAQPYRPEMTLAELQEVLERGGFEFRTTAQLREVNAAILNTKEVERHKDLIKTARASRILEEQQPDNWKAREVEKKGA